MSITKATLRNWYGKPKLAFSKPELAHIKEALILMRDIDACNCQRKGDQYDMDAEFSAELIHKIEEEGV